MKASPEAAPMPVMKRVGMLQKIARAEVLPISPTASEPDSTDMTRPAAPRPQASVRLFIFYPLLSTSSAHQIIAAVANRYGIAVRTETIEFDTPRAFKIC